MNTKVTLSIWIAAVVLVVAAPGIMHARAQGNLWGGQIPVATPDSSRPQHIWMLIWPASNDVDWSLDPGRFRVPPSKVEFMDAPGSTEVCLPDEKRAEQCFSLDHILFMSRHVEPDANRK